MNKIFFFFYILVFCVVVMIGIISAPTITRATVGGPTYVYNLKYNPNDESVYYTEQNQSGKGCPPILSKISLHTGETSTVFSCDEGFALSTDEDFYPAQSVYNKIEEITKGFKPLTFLNLKENSIDLDVSFVKDKFFNESDILLRKNFITWVYQDGIKTDEFPINGCSVEQPFSFAGYAIPGFNKKIIILSSAVSDSFEGGYIREGLHVVNIPEVKDRIHFV